jgi:parvulin-like peptidyl-prolyl isomerase
MRGPAPHRTLVTWSASLLLLLALALVARGQDRPRPAAPPAAPRSTANDPVLARVDGKAIRRSEIELRKERGMVAYRKETGREVPPAFQAFFLRTALDEAVRERLLSKDARARGVRVSDADAEAVLKSDAMFHVDGRFDPARFAAYEKANPRSFAQVREEARDFVAFQRRARDLESELAPDAATIDRLVALRTEKVRVQAVLVSETQFDGRTDPTDEQLRATYAKDRDTFIPPGRVAFTTLTVPGLEDGRASAPALARARQKAEEWLAEVQRGEPFDSLARRPGLLPGRGTWGQGQATGVFAGEPAWAESAFASAPGRVLPHVFETTEGYALVRIERATPRTVPTLADVANDVRARWRAETMDERDRAEARRFYDAHPDSFRSPAWVVRWATVDAARVPVKEPKEKDLRTWFEAHQSEFSRLDPAGGGVRMQTWEEAREEARARFAKESRATEARALADRLATAWARGKSASEKGPAVLAGGPTMFVPGTPLPPGLRSDLADSVRRWTTAPRAIVVPDPAGFAVVGLVRRSESERPDFAAVEPLARAAIERGRLAEERAAARAWFEARRERYVTGPGYAITFATSLRPPNARVDVPGEILEREYRTHLGDYTPREEVHVRHILFMTGQRSAAEALTLAREARGRVARGEDFAAVARQVSEDPSTREAGGDLGWVAAGTTVPEFERAAFALTPKSPYSQPVQTTFGVHLIQLVERRGGVPTPFADARYRVTEKVIAQYADTLAREAAERLFHETKDAATLMSRAAALTIPVAFLRWHEGFPLNGPAVLDDFRADAATVIPGEPFPRVYRYQEQGYVVAVLDSVLPSRPLEFEDAAERVLADYRRESRLDAARVRAEQVEKDLAAGRSWREATETLGGSSEPVLVAYAEPLPGFGTLPGLDSLLFGPAPLPAGARGRVETPRGTLIVSVAERVGADATVRARERENVRRTVLNRRIYDYVEGLRAGAKIEVLSEDLADRPPAPPKL